MATLEVLDKLDDNVSPAINEPFDELVSEAS